MKKIILPFMAILLFTSCKKEPTNGAGKIRICHKTSSGVKSKWIIIEVNKSALPAHLAHGDVRLDDQDNDGYVPNNGSGFGIMGDCDDTNAAINPGATEIVGNESDENCNGQFGADTIESVNIGGTVCMAKNLDVSKYSNGDDILLVTDPAIWSSVFNGPGVSCYYDNAEYGVSYDSPYGKLYNSWAVTDSRGLAPVGWHVAKEEDWIDLIWYLGGGQVAGGKMKETGTTHWLTPNTGATNSSGFTGLPGGERNEDGQFQALGMSGVWWIGDDYNITQHFSQAVFLNYATSTVRMNLKSKKWGFSVRCVRNR